MISHKNLCRLLLLPVLAGPLVALAAPAYTVAFAPAGFTIQNFAPSNLNNRGQIIGNSGGLPAIWQGSRVTRFAALADHFAYGINNRGDIVGSSASGPFVHTSAGTRYITIGQPWDEDNRATGLNDAREVIGWAHAPAGESARGFLHSRRGTALIGTFGGDWSYAFSLNSAGHVVGYAQSPSPTNPFGAAQAFLYKNGVSSSLGTLGGLESRAWDINDAGQIVGYAELPRPPGSEEFDYAPFHAFLYQRGRMKDLGTLGGPFSSANAINNDGVVVGETSLADDGGRVAFVYEGGKMKDLNKRVSLAPGWTLANAIDINDKDQILVLACYLGDCSYWARLTPLRKAHSSSTRDGQEPSDTAEANDGAK
jgi:probable HAF family extracellular repeat protein